MKIEVPARWFKYKDDDESKKERKLNRIIGKEEEYDFFDDSNVEYSYAPLTLELKDIVGFNLLDVEHTTVRVCNQPSYVIKIPYLVFKSFYTFMSGEEIKSIENFTFENKMV